MYSNEKLNSKNAISLYESIAKRTLGYIYIIESEVCKTNKKRDLKVNFSDKSFELFNNTITYSGVVKSNGDGRYLSIDAMKEIGENGLDVVLVTGIKGFDITTGEGYDRKLAMVSYSYSHGKIDVKSVMDENDIENEETLKFDKFCEQDLGLKR